MISADQVTAIVPDAASLKAGRGLATPRKWQTLGGDESALWGLAMGSGKNPYQTRVDLSDLASKCSCPSRKFPCKHAIALMLVAASEPASLSEKTRPDWLTEWLDSRAERKEKQEKKSQERVAKPTDEKAAARRRAKKESRIGEGVELLRQTLHDLAREGLASAAARDAGLWEELQRRMIDCQLPGLAGVARSLADELPRAADADRLLADEVGRLHLLCEAYRHRDRLDDPGRAELRALLGDGPGNEEVLSLQAVEDEWFVATREIHERDRLLTSVSWLWGVRSRKWAKLLRFAHAPATIAEPWPVGSTVNVGLSFDPGPLPRRARPHGDGHTRMLALPEASDAGFEALLERHAAELATSPFQRNTPFLLEGRPDAPGRFADTAGRSLPWRADATTALRVECITGGAPALVGGEWDGCELRLLAIADGETWSSLTPRPT